jgi:2-methylisocitrate lyase-like PEP mutase family enzyme
MPSQAQKLRELINAGEHFIVADAYSALTGRIVERVGFLAACFITRCLTTASFRSARGY